MEVRVGVETCLPTVDSGRVPSGSRRLGDKQRVLSADGGGGQAVLGLLRPFARLLGWMLPVARAELPRRWGDPLETSRRASGQSSGCPVHDFSGKKGSELALSWAGMS